MNVDPATRRANRWLFVALIAFAICLCAFVLISMRVHTERKGGKVYPPPPPTSSFVPAGKLFVPTVANFLVLCSASCHVP